MLNQGVGSWIARRARRTPDRVAIVHGDRALTYRQLHGRVSRLAGALRGLGVARGDRVAFLGPNHPAYLETLFAAGTLGAVLVPLNMRLAGPELAHHLTDSGTSVLVYAPAQAAVVASITGGLPLRHVVALAGPRDGEHGYEDLLAGAAPDAADEPVGLDEPCLIMYTSGTTGRAKGATLTHGNITWNAINVLVDADFGQDEVALVVAPLFHTAALNMLCLPAILKGGTVLVESAFDPARALALIARHRVTSMFGVPAIYDAMAATAGWAGADISSLRTLLCGGAPVPEATIRTYLARGVTFIQGYGMTETSPGALLLDAAHVESKAGSAGIPHFFTDVRVVGPGLAEVAPGERGEIVVAGPNVMAGYWGQPEATAAAMASGTWLRSGDVATADEDGYVFVVDRIKDVIISGGENIYPAEVENAVRDHPAVAECGVIGVPDEKWGETIKALVVRRPGAVVSDAELIAHCRERMAHFKAPTTVEFREALDRTATGKLQKYKLRQPFWAGRERTVS